MISRLLRAEKDSHLPPVRNLRAWPPGKEALVRPPLFPGPLRFRPYLRPMVWGGRRLAELLGKPLPPAEPYGEAWEISDHGSHHSVVAGGPDRGRTLRDLLRQDPAGLVGEPDAEAFPWLIKYL